MSHKAHRPKPATRHNRATQQEKETPCPTRHKSRRPRAAHPLDLLVNLAPTPVALAPQAVPVLAAARAAAASSSAAKRSASSAPRRSTPSLTVMSVSFKASLP